MSYARHGGGRFGPRYKWGTASDLREWFKAIRTAIKKQRNASRRRMTREQ